MHSTIHSNLLSSHPIPPANQVLDQRISKLEETGSKATADGAKAAGGPSGSSKDQKLADDDDASKDGPAEVADQKLAGDDDASKHEATEVAAVDAPPAVAASATAGAGAGGGGGGGGGAGSVTPEQLEAVHARLKMLETQAMVSFEGFG